MRGLTVIELVLVVLWLGSMAGLAISWLVHQRRARRLRRFRTQLDAKMHLNGLIKRDVQ